MKDAETKAKNIYKKEKFEKIIFFGDGIWDYYACKNLKYNFIAVNKKKEKFFSLNTQNIISNYLEYPLCNLY